MFANSEDVRWLRSERRESLVSLWFSRRRTELAFPSKRGSLSLPTLRCHSVHMSTLSRIRPLLNRVLVARLEKETATAGGLLIPESMQSKMNQGSVVAVGPGARDKVRLPADVQPKIALAMPLADDFFACCRTAG